MSNILTSYFRIYPKNRKPINLELQQYLFNNIVQSSCQFGSYWVRIEKQWNESENALDIRFGSSKSYHTSDYILEHPELHYNYFVWERRANEGETSDRIIRYYIDDRDGLVDETCENCLYGFDRVIITGSGIEKYFSNFPISQNDNGIELMMEGTYFSSNDRSFQDITKDSRYHSPCLDYDSRYIAPRFSNEKDITCIQPRELAEVIEKLKARKIRSPEIDSIELFWKNKIVNKQQWGNINQLGYDEWLIYPGDNWDNCLNDKFLKFRQSYHSINDF